MKAQRWAADASTCDGSELGGRDWTIDISGHLLKASLDIQFLLLGVHVDKNKLSLAVERILQVVKGHNVRISEHGGWKKRQNQ